MIVKDGIARIGDADNPEVWPQRWRCELLENEAANQTGTDEGDSDRGHYGNTRISDAIT